MRWKILFKVKHQTHLPSVVFTFSSRKVMKVIVIVLELLAYLKIRISNWQNTARPFNAEIQDHI